MTYAVAGDLEGNSGLPLDDVQLQAQDEQGNDRDEIMQALSLIKRPGRLRPEDEAPIAAVKVDDKKGPPPSVEETLKAQGEKAVEEAAAAPVPAVQGEPASPSLEDKRAQTKFAAQHKREQELFQRQENIKTEEKALAEKYATYKEFADFTPEQLRAFRDAKTSPAHLLREMGFTDIKELLNRLADDGGVETPQARTLRELKAEVTAMREKEQRGIEEKARADKELAEKAAHDNFRGEIGSFVKGNVEKYGLLQLPGGVDAVLNELQGNEDLSLEEASAKAEALVRKNITEDLVTNPVVQQLVKEHLAKSSSQGRAAGPASSMAPVKTLSGSVSTRVAPLSDKVPDDNQLLSEAMAFLNRRRR